MKRESRGPGSALATVGTDGSGRVVCAERPQSDASQDSRRLPLAGSGNGEESTMKRHRQLGTAILALVCALSAVSHAQEAFRARCPTSSWGSRKGAGSSPARWPTFAGPLFSPTTRYRDYAISRELIHWESQASTRAESETGQRYRRHQELGTSVMLFARLRSDDRAFWFLGPVFPPHHGQLEAAWRRSSAASIATSAAHRCRHRSLRSAGRCQPPSGRSPSPRTAGRRERTRRSSCGRGTS